MGFGRVWVGTLLRMGGLSALGFCADLDSMKTTSVVLLDRIYIHADLDKRDIPKRFLEVMEHFREDGTDFDNATPRASELLEEAITLARKG